MKYLLFIVLVGALTWGSQSEAQTARNLVCGNYNTIKDSLLKNYGEVPFWMAKAHDASGAVILFENKATGSWTALKLPGNGVACQIGNGSDATHIGRDSSTSDSTTPICGDGKPWKYFEDQYSTVSGVVYGSITIDSYFKSAGYSGPIKTIYESVGYAAFEKTGVGMLAFLVDGCPVDFELTTLEYVQEILDVYPSIR